MPFSPREIEHKEFVASFRGYNRDEVRAFLRAAAADYQAALEPGPRAEGAELETRAATLSGIVSAAAEMKRNAALAEQRAEIEAADIRERAEREARQIVSEARRQADEVREAVERATSERIEEVARKTEDLRALEERMSRRLYFVETALELARRDLGIEASTSPSRDDRQGELPVSAKQYQPRDG